MKTYITKLSDIDQINLINECVKKKLIYVPDSIQKCPINRNFPYLGIEFGDGDEKPGLDLYREESKKPRLLASDFKQLVKNYKPKVYEQVKLNNEYTAVVLEDHIKVGCQMIPFDAINQIYDIIQTRNTVKLVKKMNKK